MSKNFSDHEPVDQLQQTYLRLREQHSAFSGVSFQMKKLGERLVSDFERAGSIHHRGDRGTAREQQLRNFLLDEGYLPSRFGVSQGTASVVSTTGHQSAQMDLVLYDNLSAPKLMDFENVQYFPCESVYGAIQIKSNLDKKQEVIDALENLATYKRLARSRVHANRDTRFHVRGFGGVFAYDATLSWQSIRSAVVEYEKSVPPSMWPNFIFILGQGLIHNVSQERVLYDSCDIDKIATEPDVWAWPSTLPSLQEFYLVLMDLLCAETLPRPPLREYLLLPHVAGRHSYRFTHSAMQLAQCDKHGTYLVLFTDEAIEKIHSFCASAPSVHFIDAINEAYGRPPATSDQKALQPQHVRIYNPGQRPLSEILLAPEQIFLGKSSRALGYFDIQIDQLNCYVPQSYAETERLILGCPKCKR